MESITDEELFTITTYSQVCEKMKIKELCLEDFQIYKGHAKKFFAFFKLKVIEKFFNQNWVADWNDRNQSKYYPYFYRNSSGGWVAGDGVAYVAGGCFYGSVAYYKDRRTALHVGNNFKDIYLDLIL